MLVNAKDLKMQNNISLIAYFNGDINTILKIFRKKIQEEIQPCGVIQIGKYPENYNELGTKFMSHQRNIRARLQ